MILEEKLPENLLVDPPKEGGHGQNVGIQRLKRRIQFGQISDMILHRKIFGES